MSDAYFQVLNASKFKNQRERESTCQFEIVLNRESVGPKKVSISNSKSVLSRRFNSVVPVSINLVFVDSAEKVSVQYKIGKVHAKHEPSIDPSAEISRVQLEYYVVAREHYAFH